MGPLRYGLVIPLTDARAASELAREAEACGWDGFFVGEAVWSIDAWVTLAAAAVRTSRIRLGTMLTPMPQVAPWKLAAESATLDHLSQGRVILGLGTGATWMGWQAFPQLETDTKARAQMLDEGIDILTLLYAGEPFDYTGQHYQVKLTLVDRMHYPPPPVQRPRIPLWAVGVWPRMRSMRRVLKCDGLIPARMAPDGQFAELRPEDLREMKAFVAERRALATPFDIVVEGNTMGLDAAQARAKLEPWAEAGATWWLETLFGVASDDLVARVRQGPPRLA
jgi:alkanesulfonate monooxygenase SsuD/methylene tetrahydromethanopterin reductase-like flavin-dependent oxidoreductase (luciferase family)